MEVVETYRGYEIEKIEKKGRVMFKRGTRNSSSTSHTSLEKCRESIDKVISSIPDEKEIVHIMDESIYLTNKSKFRRAYVRSSALKSAYKKDNWTLQVF